MNFHVIKRVRKKTADKADEQTSPWVVLDLVKLSTLLFVHLRISVALKVKGIKIDKTQFVLLINIHRYIRARLNCFHAITYHDRNETIISFRNINVNIPGQSGLWTDLGEFGLQTASSMVRRRQSWDFHPLGRIFGAQHRFRMVLVELERYLLKITRLFNVSIYYIPRWHQTRTCGIHQEALWGRLHVSGIR